MEIISKYRFWDKKNKKFRYDLYLSNEGVFDIYNDYGGMFSSDLRKDNVTSQVVVQQFIGQFDKNAKAIYEGDLINYAMYKKEEVIYRLGKFCLKDGFILPTSIADMLEIEVVGNIFQP